MEGDPELLLDLRGQPVAVGVVKADVERLQPAQHGRADPPGGYGADLHALQVVPRETASAMFQPPSTTILYEGM